MTSHSQDPKPSAEERRKLIELSKRGHLLLKENNVHQARELFEQALRLDPENPYILNGLGECYKKVGELDRAAECYKDILVFDPQNQFALRGLGDIYKERKDFRRAIDLWSRYLKGRPNDVFVLMRIADAYKALNAVAEAEGYYKKALAVNAGDHYALMGLADLYHKCGQKEKAVIYYEKLLQKNPRLINIWTIVANLCYQLEDFPKAKHSFEKALEIEPDNTYALFGLGNCYRWEKDYLKAVEFWEPLYQRNELNPSMLSRLGDMYCRLERLGDAETVYHAGLAKSFDRYAHLGLLKLCCRNGDEARLFTLLDAHFRHEPATVEIFEVLSDLLVQAGRKEMALALCRYGLERCALKPDEAQVLKTACAKLAN